MKSSRDTLVKTSLNIAKTICHSLHRFEGSKNCEIIGRDLRHLINNETFAKYSLCKYLTFISRNTICLVQALHNNSGESLASSKEIFILGPASFFFALVAI